MPYKTFKTCRYHCHITSMLSCMPSLRPISLLKSIWKLHSQIPVPCVQMLLSGVSSQLRILVASIKTVDQILALAVKGVSSYALPSTLLGELIVDRDTEDAARDFEQAAARNQPRLFL